MISADAESQLTAGTGLSATPPSLPAESLRPSIMSQESLDSAMGTSLMSSNYSSGPLSGDSHVLQPSQFQLRHPHSAAAPSNIAWPLEHQDAINVARGLEQSMFGQDVGEPMLAVLLEKKLSHQCIGVGIGINSLRYRSPDDILLAARTWRSVFARGHVRITSTASQMFGHGTSFSKYGYNVTVVWQFTGVYVPADSTHLPASSDHSPPRGTTSRDVEIEGITFYRVRMSDCKVTQIKRYWDSAWLFEQLGFAVCRPEVPALAPLDVATASSASISVPEHIGMVVSPHRMLATQNAEQMQHEVLRVKSKNKKTLKNRLSFFRLWFNSGRHNYADNVAKRDVARAAHEEQHGTRTQRLKQFFRHHSTASPQNQEQQAQQQAQQQAPQQAQQQEQQQEEEMTRMAASTTVASA